MPSQTLPRAQLDHIIILLPLEQLHNLPTWLSDNFTITPGGRHADGLTENVLILLQDGVYLELIAFSDTTTPEQRADHWWGRKPYGIVDYAFTLPPGDYDKDFAQFKSMWEDAKVKGEWVPPTLIPGGRTRPDGQKIEWKVAFPDVEQRGIVNFWCFDVTPRDYRVPLSESSTKHSSGVTGVASVEIVALEVSRLDAFFHSFLDSTDGGYTIDTPTDGSAPSQIRVSGGKAGIRISLLTTGEKKVIKGELGNITLDFALV